MSGSASVQLSWRWLALLNIGMPLVLAGLLVGGWIAWIVEGGSVVELLGLVLVGAVLIAMIWWHVGLTSVCVDDRRLHVRGWFVNRRFMLADISEVLVKYQGGTPWTVFRVRDEKEGRTLSYRTALTPVVGGVFRSRAHPDLSVLEGVPIRYFGFFGREEKMLASRKSD